MSAVSPWNRLTVRRFRGLRDVSLEGLGALNVLVGANDTGKTSLLEAIFLLSGSGNLTVPIRVQNLRDHLVHTLDDLSYLFHECDVTGGIELSAAAGPPVSDRSLSITAGRQDTNGSILSSRDLNSKPNGSRSPAIPSSTMPVRAHHNLRYDLKVSEGGDSAPRKCSGSLTLRDAEQVVRVDASLAETTIAAQFVTHGLDHAVKAVGAVVVKKRKQELLDYLRFVNPRIQDIAVSGSRAFLDVGLDRMLPINMFGSGMIRACSIIAHCVVGESRILLVDEMSSGLHYHALVPMLKTMLRFSTERGVQMFVTTHSLSVLQSLREILDEKEMAELQDAVVCYALQRDAGGQVRAYRYGHEELDHCIRSGIEIR